MELERETLFELLRAAYVRGCRWMADNGSSEEYLMKSASDYADATSGIIAISRAKRLNGKADMPKSQTDEQVAALADAMVAVMNDMAEGNAVCDLVKAMARISVEPFLLDDYGDMPDLEWAKEVVAKCDAPYA